MRVRYVHLLVVLVVIVLHVVNVVRVLHLVHKGVLIRVRLWVALLRGAILEELSVVALIEVVVRVARVVVIIWSISGVVVGVVVIGVLVRILLIIVFWHKVAIPTSVLTLLIIFLEQVVKRFVLNKLRWVRLTVPPIGNLIKLYKGNTRIDLLGHFFPLPLAK